MTLGTINLINKSLLLALSPVLKKEKTQPTKKEKLRQMKKM
jgi:hypothetical protein